MFDKSSFLLVALAMMLGACTNPKYANAQNLKSGNPEQKADACQARFASGHCVAITWQKTPTETEFGSFVFTTFQLNDDGSKVDVNLGSMAVVLIMPSMGHGSSPVTVMPLSTGKFEASNVFFIMKGDWEIHVQVKDVNEIKDQAVIPVTF